LFADDVTDPAHHPKLPQDIVAQRGCQVIRIGATRAGYANPDWIRRDPDLVCLHGEPEFEKLFEG